MGALSSKRRYAPSLLVLRWANEERQNKDKDQVGVNDGFMDMVRLLFLTSIWFMHFFRKGEELCRRIGFFGIWNHGDGDDG